MGRNGLRGNISQQEQTKNMIDIYCTTCNAPYPDSGAPFQCDLCGGIFDFRSLPIYREPEENQIHPGIWRYCHQFGLPDTAPIISLGEGMTPLIWTTFFGHQVALKMDFLNPTGSFKDRGSAVLVSFLQERGIGLAVEDSSGNAGASFAAYAARSGIKARVYVPDSTSGPKIAQMEAYGAQIVRVPGQRSNAADAVRKAAEMGEIYASHAFLPHGIIGYATVAYELWEQLGSMPGTVLCPVGQGNLLLGIGRGFEAIKTAGLISKLPLLVGVQSQVCAPIWEMSTFAKDGSSIVSESETIAEGIRIKKPIRANILLDFININDGLILATDDESIVESYRKLAKLGIFVEPTSAVVHAGLKQIIGDVPEPIVLVLTGSGLKVQLIS